MLRAHVSEQLGAIARPDDIRFADNLPKTRSGKILRRLLRAIARNEDITQDLSTLENPAIIDQLRGSDAPGKPAKAPPKSRAAASKKAKPKPKPKTAAKKKSVAKRPAAPARKKAPAKKAAVKKAAVKRKAGPKRKPAKRPVPKKRAAPRRGK